MSRLDKWLVENKFTTSRTKAKELIENSQVLVNQKICQDPNFKISESDNVQFTTDDIDHYVSRSAHKLKAAMSHFNIKGVDLEALDIGMSTGGFTQVLLEAGVKKVVGVDVGKNQLHSSLRLDPRVECYEGINVKEGLPFTFQFDLSVIDVSFISVLKILPNVVKSIKPGGTMLVLIKPQFEQEGENKKLILSDKQSLITAQKVRSTMLKWNLKCSELFLVPLKGKEGNQEYFIRCDI